MIAATGEQLLIVWVVGFVVGAVIGFSLGYLQQTLDIPDAVNANDIRWKPKDEPPTE